jgi:hypothetical protein
MEGWRAARDAEVPCLNPSLPNDVYLRPSIHIHLRLATYSLWYMMDGSTRLGQFEPTTVNEF